MTLKKSGLELSGYDHMLYNLLPQLENYKHASGGEGNAYFIDDKFVDTEFDKYI